jgi:dipicolinate synthase subunit B
LILYKKEVIGTMPFQGKNMGIALTGSFCTYDKVFIEIERLVEANANIYTIFSDSSRTINTRFGNAKDFLEKAAELTGKPPITTIENAEPLGPKNLIDILILAPCTGNTLSKLANGISDTPVLMAAKGHLRNNKPLVISLSTNDALGMNLKNIGILLNTKNIYFVPFGQDNCILKPNSMISHTHLMSETIQNALEGQQLQPVIQSPH